jgi:hypothetical protein
VLIIVLLLSGARSNNYQLLSENIKSTPLGYTSYKCIDDICLHLAQHINSVFHWAGHHRLAAIVVARTGLRFQRWRVRMIAFRILTPLVMDSSLLSEITGA